jgi:exonuclease VII large subunit
VQDEAGRVIKSPVEAPAGTRIRARLAEGEVRAVVTA